MRKCTVIVRYGIGVALIVRFPAREQTGAAALHTTRVTPDRITNAFHRMAELFDLREDPDELDNVIDRPGYRQVHDERGGRRKGGLKWLAICST